MKFKLIFFLFNAIILISFAVVLLMPFFLLGQEYWLYIVSNASTQPTLYVLNDPASRLHPNKEVEIVRYVIQDWKDEAQLTS